MPDQLADHSVDTWWTASLRFVFLELVPWIAGPWAASDQLRGEGAGVRAGVATAVGVGLVLLPALFSCRGDKLKSAFWVPGWVRLLLVELPLAAVAGWAPFVAWGEEAGWAFAVLTGVSVVAGLPRWWWLVQGCPDAWGEPRGFKRLSQRGSVVTAG